MLFCLLLFFVTNQQQQRKNKLAQSHSISTNCDTVNLRLNLDQISFDLMQFLGN